LSNIIIVWIAACRVKWQGLSLESTLGPRVKYFFHIRLSRRYNGMHLAQAFRWTEHAKRKAKDHAAQREK